MPFDLATARPIQARGFDLSTARPVESDQFAGDDLLSNESMAQLAAGASSTVTPTRQPSMLDRAGKYAGEYLGGLKQAAQAALPTSGMPIMDAGRAMLGIGEAGATIATGAFAPVLASARGIVTGKAPTNEDISRLTYEPRSAAGKAALGLSAAGLKPATDIAEETGADIALAPLAAESNALRSVSRGRADIRPPVPSAKELATASNQVYQRAKQAGVVISQPSVTRAASAVRQAAQKENLNPKLHPKTAAAIEHLEEVAARGQPLSLEEADQLRQVIKDAQTSIEKADRRMAGIALRRYDDYLQKLGPQDTLAGNAQEAVKVLNEARSIYRRKSNAEMVEEMVRRAEINAGAKYTQAGMEHALRSEFKKLAMNEKKLRMFSTEQRQAIERVAKGGPIENAMRNLGKFDPTQGGMSTTMAASLGGGVGFGLGGPVGSGIGAGVLSALGYVGRRGATRATAKNVERAREALVGRGLPQTNRIAELAPNQADEIRLTGEAFDDERAAAAAAARGGYDVEELPASAVREITLETPANRLQQLESPQRAAAARSGVSEPKFKGYTDDGLASYVVQERHGYIGKPSQSTAPTSQTVKQIESEMRALIKRANSLPADSPELLEMDALYQTLKDERALARQRTSRGRNRIQSLAPGEG